MDIIKSTQNRIIRKKLMKHIDFNAPFFEPFREYYSPYFFEWVEKKRDDFVYIVEEDDKIKAFLKLKAEFEDENYDDIYPKFTPKKRLKICSLKVDDNHEIARQFMILTLLRAKDSRLEEVYGTFPADMKKKANVVGYLKKWGFVKKGIKQSHNLTEEVYVKSMDKDSMTLNQTFPVILDIV